MTLKEIFHFNNLMHKIKLDKSERENSTALEKDILSKDKNDYEYLNSNEWNQEYELIYLSYVLEK